MNLGLLLLYKHHFYLKKDLFSIKNKVTTTILQRSNFVASHINMAYWSAILSNKIEESLVSIIL